MKIHLFLVIATKFIISKDGGPESQLRGLWAQYIDFICIKNETGTLLFSNVHQSAHNFSREESSTLLNYKNSGAVTELTWITCSWCKKHSAIDSVLVFYNKKLLEEIKNWIRDLLVSELNKCRYFTHWESDPKPAIKTWSQTNSPAARNTH